MVLASSSPGARAAGPPGSPRPTLDEAAERVIWHDLECGRYRADLPLWRELAAGAGGAAILDVGAGTGRVALDLATAGHRVSALERDEALLAELRRRAAGTSVEGLAGDARSLALGRRDYALCVVPMQTVQLLGGPAGRAAFLRGARAHLRRGGLLACAIVAELEPFDCAAGDEGPRPEMTRAGGALHISRPTRVHVGARTIRIERERLLLAEGHAPSSPGARPQPDVVELDRLTSARLEREGAAAGFAAQALREVPATEDHVASEVVVLRA